MATSALLRMGGAWDDSDEPRTPPSPRYKERKNILDLIRAHDECWRLMDVFQSFDFTARDSVEETWDFRKNMKSRYGWERNEELGRPKVWSPCPCLDVTDDEWIDSFYVEPTMIFPLAYGPKMMTYIFGKDVVPDAEKTINSAENGLYLPFALEHAFRNHQVTIAPATLSINSNLPEYKFFVLDKKLRNRGLLGFGTTKFHHIHDRRLVFPNSFRPRAEFLRFHFLIAMKKNRMELPDYQTIHDFLSPWIRDGPAAVEAQVLTWLGFEWYGWWTPDCGKLIETMDEIILDNGDELSRAVASMEIARELEDGDGSDCED